MGLRQVELTSDGAPKGLTLVGALGPPGSRDWMSAKRNAVVAVAFTAILVAIADLAWATSVTTSEPWFSSAASSQTYVATLVGSTLLVIGLAIAASLHIASIGDAVAELDRRIAVIRGSARADRRSSAPRVLTDREIEDELDEVLGLMQRDVALIEIQSTPKVAVPAATMQETRSLLRELVTERMSTRKGVSAVRWAVSGPIISSIVFGAIASAMLPAVERFGLRNYQLNTALVLFLSYGWPFLVGWAVAAIALSRPIRPS